MSKFQFILIGALMSVFATADQADARGCRSRGRQQQACVQTCAPVCSPCDQFARAGCSASVNVYFNGNTICIKGKVGCSGKECEFDVCLGDGDATVDCGDMQVKLKPRGSQVCIEARVKIFGNWTPWVDLGCYP